MKKYISISLVGSEVQRPEFRDVVHFLWDFNLLYETSRLIVDPKYERFRITPYVYTRHGRPLHKEDRLELVQLQHESPLKLTTIVGLSVAAAAGMWAIVQTAQTVENWHLQNQKLIAEVRKTELEARKTELEIDKLEDEKAVRRQASQAKKSVEKIQPKKEKVVVFPPWGSVRTVDRQPARELQEFQKHIQARGAEQEMSSIIHRFQISPVKIEDIDIKIVSEDSK